MLKKAFIVFLLFAGAGSPLFAQDEAALKQRIQQRADAIADMELLQRQKVGCEKITPAEFVDAARLDSAKRLLQDTAKSLQQIASLCGFGNADGRRRAFFRYLGVGPAE